MGNQVLMTEANFLNLCRIKDDEVTVREALEQQPDLVKCRERVPSYGGRAEASRESSNGRTALHIASGNGREKVVRVLLEYGAEVNVRDAYETSPLHDASDGGHDRVARLLLEHGADVNARGDDGLTPLHDASYNGYEKLARLLLEYGADRRIKDDKGETARDVSISEGEFRITTLLDSYFPITAQMVQVLLGLRGPTESPLTRFAGHSAFEPQVLSLVKCLLTGEQSAVFEQLLQEVWG